MERTLLTFKKTRILILLYFMLCALEGGVLLANLLTDSSSKITRPFWTIPTLQLVEMMVFGLASFLFLCCGITLFSHVHFWSNAIQKYTQLHNKYPQLLKSLILILLLIYFFIIHLLNIIFVTNMDYARTMLDYLSIWIFLLLLQTIILITIIKRQSVEGNFTRQFVVILGIFYAIWILIIITGVGIIPDTSYWNVAGVPVMALQVAVIQFISLFVDYLIVFIRSKFYISLLRIPIWVDILISLLLWAGAAYFWNTAPFDNSFFANGPYPPNEDFIPYSDAALIDLGGQYMLIGESLNYPFFTEKTLYVFFLGLLHFFAGQSYLTTTSLQIVIFAVFPVLLYWLGIKFQGRLLGVSLGIFAIVKEKNALISTFKISVSNSRLYMTEFPTAIGMLALGLVLFLWFRHPNKKMHLVIFAGGILGFSSMIRTNPILLIPFVLIIALFVYRFQWKKWLVASLIFMCGFFLAVTPWVVYDQVSFGTNPYTAKIDAVWKLRFSNAPLKSAPPVPGISDRFLLNFDLTVPSTAPPEENIRSLTKNETVIDKAHIVIGHFLNNEIKALFILPFQLYPQDYKVILSEPYWKEPDLWQGDLPTSVAAAFALNLGLIALGISYSWKKWRYGGLVPLALNIGYYFSNALGRTSGSRYLLPVDWVIYFYFFVAIFFIIQWIGSPGEKNSLLEPEILAPKNTRIEKNQSILTIVLGFGILLFGGLIPIINSSFPKLYPEVDKNELVNKLNLTPIYENTGLTESQIHEFLAQQDGTVLFGRMLYPREEILYEEDKKGLFVTVLTPEIIEVFIPLDQPIGHSLPAGSDVLVIGCNKNGYIEGFLAYIFESDALIIAPRIVDALSCSKN